jgi:hypothetical protein
MARADPHKAFVETNQAMRRCDARARHSPLPVDITTGCVYAGMEVLAALVWCRTLVDQWVQQRPYQLRRDEHHTKAVILLVALMSRQNRKQRRLSVDFGATGH